MLTRFSLRVMPQLAGAGMTVLHRILRGLCAAATPSRTPPKPLSPAELDTISTLIQRLISNDQVPGVGRLLSAALLLPGSPERLLFPPLDEHLASLPTLTPTFALLTALRHNPVRSSPLPLAIPLLGHLLSMRRPRHAASLLRWFYCLESPCHPNDATYEIAVIGFCRLEDPKNALVVLWEMAVDVVRISQKLREEVRDAMLHDSSIEEMRALEEAMRQLEPGKMVELVDKLLGQWED